MNPIVKYTLARLGLFVAVAAILLVIPIDVHFYLKLALALLISAGLALVLLRGLRDEVSTQVAVMVQKRKENRERLRAALAGDDDS